MDSKIIPPLFGSLLLCVFNFLPQTNSFEAIQVATLPKSVGLLTPFYDSTSDTIFLFGGFTDVNVPNSDIFSFSLTSETVQTVGQIPEVPDAWGNVLVLPNSNASHLFYLVTTYNQDSTIVFKFNPLDGSSVQIGEIPVALFDSAFTKAPNGNLYAVGGEKTLDQIVKLDLDSETIQSEVVGTLERQFIYALSANVGTIAYVFGTVINSTNPDIHYDYFLLNLETLETSNHEGEAPTYMGVPSVTSTNRGEGEIFLIGGNSANPKDGLIRIKADDNTLEYLPVDNFPKEPGASYLLAPSAVYVEKLNRIYFFGGLSYLNVYVEWFDSVWYVDLKDLPL